MTMETISRTIFISNRVNIQFPIHRNSLPKKTSFLSALKTSSPIPVTEEDDLLQVFFKDRETNGDFISKVSDKLWQREFVGLVVAAADDIRIEQASRVAETGYDFDYEDDDGGGGFLKLSKTQEWVLGDNSAPINKKDIERELRDDRERRKKLSLLDYEAIKRELMLLSVGIGMVCSGYCLVALSVQAGVSYAVGVSLSCLYLQLLYQHADNLSKETVPQIFMKKKSKKIGIRSEDLNDSLEKSIRGIGLALSSPRLGFPAVIYGLWALSHKFISSDFFDFQLVPAMVGLFVYKAAALVQVYRDNQDLQFIFPDNE